MTRPGTRTDTSGITEGRSQSPAPASRSPSTGPGDAIFPSPLREWHFAQHVEELGGRAVAVGSVVTTAGPLYGSVCSRIEREHGDTHITFIFPDASEQSWTFVGGYGR